jgi:hypothetical protein
VQALLAVETWLELFKVSCQFLEESLAQSCGQPSCKSVLLERKENFYHLHLLAPSLSHSNLLCPSAWPWWYLLQSESALTSPGKPRLILSLPKFLHSSPSIFCCLHSDVYQFINLHVLTYLSRKATCSFCVLTERGQASVLPKHIFRFLRIKFCVFFHLFIYLFIYLFLTLLTDIRSYLARHWWFMPVIPATQEAEIRRLWFEDSLGK